MPSYLLSKELLVSEDIKCASSYIHKMLNLGFNAALKLTSLLATYTKRLPLFLKVKCVFKEYLPFVFFRFFLSSLFSAFSAVSDLGPDNAQLQCPSQLLSGFPLRQDFA